jgi:hypothetical protein
MASDDKFGAALAAGVVGLGLGALIGAAFANHPDPHTTFMNRLRQGLDPRGITLAAADLGRGVAGPVWVLTLRLPNGSLMNLQAPVDPGVAPLAPPLADAIAQRAIGYLHRYGFVVI